MRKIQGGYWLNPGGFFSTRNLLIPISFKNDKLEETTLFDAEKGGFHQTPIREKAKIHSGIHDTLSAIVIFI